MLVSPKRVLWPTDLSELSLHGGRYAHGFRDLFGAHLSVLHVIPPPLSPDMSVTIAAEIPMTVGEPEVIEASRKAIIRMLEEHFDGADKVEIDVFYGNPWQAICVWAEEHEIDLIAVATHGRTGIGHARIGSTAERIVQHAPCPVLTVKDPEREFLLA